MLPKVGSRTAAPPVGAIRRLLQWRILSKDARLVSIAKAVGTSASLCASEDAEFPPRLPLVP